MNAAAMRASDQCHRAADMAIQEAIGQLGREQFAQIVGVPVTQLDKWLDIAVIEPGACAAIEEATSKRVGCDKLRPDLGWIRNANEKVIGTFTPIEDDGAPASVMAELKRMAAEAADAKMLTFIPPDFFEAGHAAVTDGRPFNGMNLEYVVRPGSTSAQILTDVQKAMTVARLTWGDGPRIHASEEDDAMMWGALQMYDLAHGAIAALAQVSEMSNQGESPAQRARIRQNFIEGMLYHSPEGVRAKFEAEHGLLDKLAAAAVDDGDFIYLTEKLGETIEEFETNEENVRAEFDLAYGHAHGITHAFIDDGDDALVDRLIKKHGFDQDLAGNLLNVPTRLDNLYAEVQDILRVRDAATTPALASKPDELTEIAASSLAMASHGEWIRIDASSISVGSCLDEVSLILAEAKAILYGEEDLTDSHSAVYRLIGMAKHATHLAHAKLLHARRPHAEKAA